MGYRSGIYIREQLQDIAEGLSSCLKGYGFATRQGPGADEGPDTGSEILLTSWIGGWSRIQIEHNDPNSRTILDSLTMDEVFESIIYCRYEPDLHEFSYSYFREGVVVEAFSCMGMAMPALEFVSELRKVPLHSIVEGRKFMVESLMNLGVEPILSPLSENQSVSMVVVPPKNSLLKKILGALWSGD